MKTLRILIARALQRRASAKARKAAQRARALRRALCQHIRTEEGKIARLERQSRGWRLVAHLRTPRKPANIIPVGKGLSALITTTRRAA